MAIDTTDKKWSMITLPFGGPSYGGSTIEATEDQWVFVGRYWGLTMDTPVGPPAVVPTYVSNRSRAFTLTRGP